MPTHSSGATIDGVPSSTDVTSEKIATLTPMPKPSDSSALRTRPGLRRSPRAA